MARRGWVHVGAAVALGALALPPATGGDPPATPTRTLVHLSPVYAVDREYRSMRGPSSTQTIRFPEADSGELLWVTGYRAVMVGADGRSPVSQEFMCHSNLDFDALRHATLFDLPVYHTARLFTLSQGQFEVELPEGFGLPYYADEELSLTTQVLNLNPDGGSHEVRHEVTIDYVRDRELARPMKPLFVTSGWGLVLLEGETGHFGVEEPGKEHGESCLPGEAAGRNSYQDGFERRFSGHWVVEPGRQVNKTLVTNTMQLSYDSTVHYIAVHLHPFAESLELIDLTADRSVFKSDVENAEGKIGLDRVDYFSSREGVPLFKDHEYQLVSVYDNPTSQNHDSMAVMLLYVHDKQWKRATPRAVEAPVAQVERPAPAQDATIVLHTTLGDVTIGLYPSVAPRHVERMLELARGGVFETMEISRVEPGYLVQTSAPGARRGHPLRGEQRAALGKLEAELTDIEQTRGTVAMTLMDPRDAHSAEAAFYILLDRAEWLDGRRTVVGEVVEGWPVLDRMAGVPLDGAHPVESIAIERAEVR